MSTPTNQTRSSEPHPKSFFAFALNLIERSRADEPPPLWLGPVETEGMEDEAASYFTRHNRSAAMIEATLRDAILDDLRAVGVPADRLQEPFGPSVARLVDERMREKKIALLFVEQRIADAPGPKPIKASWQVIAGLCHSRRNKMLGASKNAVHESVALLLNDGIPTRDLAAGTTRHHSLRGERAYFDAMLRRGRSLRIEHSSAVDLIGSVALLDIQQVEQVQVIYEEARRRADFSGILGDQLANAICDRYDVFQCFDRAEAVLQRRQAA